MMLMGANRRGRSGMTQEGATGEMGNRREDGAYRSGWEDGRARVLGHLEGVGAAGGLHAVRAGGCVHHRNPLSSLPEAISFERGRGTREVVLLGVVQVLRRGGGTELRHRRGIL